MDGSEAIKRLKTFEQKISLPTENSLGYVESWIYKEDVEAFEMAINSLEIDEAYQLEYEKPTCDRNICLKNEYNE